MGQLVSDITTILDYKNAKKQAKSERQQILSEMATNDKTKNNLVKKALATQRAKYGASGMSNKGMTEGAVLKRLKDEIAAPYEEKKNASIEKLKKTKAKKPNLLKDILSRFDDIVG